MIVSFRVDDDGDYVLSPKTTAVSNANSFDIANKTMTGITGASADAKTLFVVNTDNNNYKTYTGIKNAPTVDNATGYAYATTGAAKLIFTIGGSVVNSSKDVTYIALNSVSKLVTSADVAPYYQYNAVVNGEIKTIDVKATGSTLSGYNSSTLTAGDDGYLLFNQSTLNSDDQYVSTSWNLTGVTASTAVGIKAKAASDEVRFGNGTYTTMGVANDCGIFVIDEKGNITEDALSTLKTDNTAAVVYTVEDGEVTNIFVQKGDFTLVDDADEPFTSTEYTTNVAYAADGNGQDQLVVKMKDATNAAAKAAATAQLQKDGYTNISVSGNTITATLNGVTTTFTLVVKNAYKVTFTAGAMTASVASLYMAGYDTVVVSVTAADNYTWEGYTMDADNNFSVGSETLSADKKVNTAVITAPELNDNVTVTLSASNI